LFLFLLFCLLFILLFLFVFHSVVSLSQTHFGNFLISSDRVFPSLSSRDSFIANSPIPDVIRSNASLEPNWRRLFHALNSACESGSANVAAQERGNASLAMNDVLQGTTTKDRFVCRYAPASIRINSESLLNETDESDAQYERHDEQRI
jgi:hypothetical protein